KPAVPADPRRCPPGGLPAVQTVPPAVGRRGCAGLGGEAARPRRAESGGPLPGQGAAFARGRSGRRPATLLAPLRDDLPGLLPRPPARRGLSTTQTGGIVGRHRTG